VRKSVTNSFCRHFQERT